MSHHPMPRLRAAAASAGALLCFGTAAAADGASDWNLVLTQRLWAATWDQAVSDVVITAPPTETSPPQAVAGQQKNVSRRSIPITALGLRYGRFSATVSRFRTQRFDGNGIYYEDDVRRDETDVSLGYQLVPGVSLALIRKTGKVSSTQTRGTTELYGLDNPNKGRATLAGLSIGAPVNDHLSLYGNVAYGRGRFTETTEIGLSVKARYTVAEVGLSYRYGLASPTWGLDAISVQAGYRAQAIRYAGFEASDFEGFPAQVTVSGSRSRSVTDGFVLGVSLVF